MKLTMNQIIQGGDSDNGSSNPDPDPNNSHTAAHIASDSDEDMEDADYVPSESESDSSQDGDVEMLYQDPEDDSFKGCGTECTQDLYVHSAKLYKEVPDGTKELFNKATDENINLVYDSHEEFRAIPEGNNVVPQEELDEFEDEAYESKKALVEKVSQAENAYKRASKHYCNDTEYVKDLAEGQRKISLDKISNINRIFNDNTKANNGPSV